MLTSLPRLSRLLPLLLLVMTSLSAAELIRPKVIVVVTFEYGMSMGDKPGEFQLWAEREKLTQTMTVPGLDHPVHFNDQGVYGVVSGTTVRASLQIQALGFDPRFDLSQSYWLVNGIAGVSPHVATEGSAAWARHVIDGDIAYEIDTREAPADWPYGIMALGNKTPLTPPVIPGWAPKPMAWTLNPALVEWAYELTKNVELHDTLEAQAHRALYVGFPAAQAAPSVLYGDSFGSCRYWHGAALQKWADDWTRLYTGGKGSCAMSNMEDHGIANALERLAALKKVDFQRVLFLRTGSNFSMPPTGQTAADSMVAEYQGMMPALEAAYRTGSPVVHALVKDWAKYADVIPGK
ncbi:Purine nucleoside permease (NUP) [Lacunisphaera limnophila]|uniref:Purine nucleoside permease (NUP) n=2 Tax=Lacunisphaera limnophila TaxID=1838286 RepID=A0A1D8AR67_9BACT|nr:Purine nucleoside permease (NUP) [Lacunisphaera limnophila]